MSRHIIDCENCGAEGGADNYSFELHGYVCDPCELKLIAKAEDEEAANGTV